MTANPYTFAVLEDVELTAIFLAPGEETYTVTVNVNDPVMGSATVNGTNTASVISGATVTLTATPNSGYHFVRWNDDNTDATRTVTVTANKSFTATFEANPTPYTITVSVNDPTMGTATVNGSTTTTVMSGTEVTLTATANQGYRFVRWNDNNTETTRTVTVTEDMNFTATFEANGTQDIDDIDANGIRIYSADGRIVVEGTTEEVRVYDVMGRSVRKESLPAGVYMVKVGTRTAKKVVVMK